MLKITDEQIDYRGPVYYENSAGILCLGKVMNWYQLPRGKKRQMILHYQVLDHRTGKKAMVPIAVCFKCRAEYDRLYSGGKMQRPRNGTMHQEGSFDKGSKEPQAAAA